MSIGGLPTTSLPFFSVCIPQYRRPKHLIVALKSLQLQTCKEIEVCISDDGSPDAEYQEILEFLKKSTLNWRMSKGKGGYRYDANLRTAIGMARGQYCFLLGNDDAIYDENTLSFLIERIHHYDYPEAIVTNYESWAGGEFHRRVEQTVLHSPGIGTVVSNFRNLAFVSGLIINRELAQLYASDRVDGSEMYQMYLYSRLIAEKGRLLCLDRVVIRKDIQIPETSVNSYANFPVGRQSWADGKSLPMIRIPDTVWAGIEENSSSISKLSLRTAVRSIISQLYTFTYPFWLVEYRRIGRYKVALGLAWGIRPKRMLAELPSGILDEVILRIKYTAMVMASFIIPVYIFSMLKPAFYKLAKRRRC